MSLPRGLLTAVGSTPLSPGVSSAQSTVGGSSTGIPGTPTLPSGQALAPLEACGAESSQEHARSSRQRWRHRCRHSNTSDTSSSSSHENSSEEFTPGPTRRKLEEVGFPLHQVGDDTLNRITSSGNYRLENQDQANTRRMAKRMSSLNRRMQPSLGGHPKYSGKNPVLIFAFLRRFVKACNNNDVSEGKALYLLVSLMTVEAEQR